MQWNDGYVADSDYVTEFVREQSPAHLSACCLLNGIEPAPSHRPFNYLELGSGLGFTANVLAASNPHGRFYAVDFLESHINASQALATQAQLDNVTFLQQSFAEIASGTVDLPMFDYIVLHGVYTWVNARNRGIIVAAIDRLLRPGGIVYVSYNALPGWSSAMPLQRLALEYADACPGEAEMQIAGARNLMAGMAAVGARYMECADPGLMFRLESWRRDKACYLAHEYMHRGWEPLYHADVAGHMAAVGLEFAGSAEPIHAWPEELLTAEQIQFLADVKNPSFRETLKDFLLNTSFRGDVFVRGPKRLTTEAQRGRLADMMLVLTVSRPAVTLPAAEDEKLGVLLDEVATQPVRLGELSLRHGYDLEFLLRLAARLHAREEGGLIFAEALQADDGAARRLNQVIARLSLRDDRFQALASPVLGSGVKSGLIQRLVYERLTTDGNPDVVDVVADIRKTLLAQDGTIALEGLSADADVREQESVIFNIVVAIMERRIPVWKQLGMV